MRPSVLRAMLLLALSPYCALAERVEVGSFRRDAEVRLLESSEERILIEVLVGAFDMIPVVIDGETFHRVGLAGESRLFQGGHPDLPAIVRSVAIPNDGRMEISVLEAEFETFDGIRVAPSKGILDRAVDPSSVPYLFGETYDRDIWYPRDLARAGEPYILRDVRGLCVTALPFQYNSYLGTLRVYTRLVIEARLAGPGGGNEIVGIRRERTSGEFARIYDQHFLNFERTAFTPVGETGDMLILAHDPLLADLAPLAEWKNRMGIKTTMVGVSSVGVDSISVRDFIQAFYDSTNLAFVLLVGDAPQMPYLTTLGVAADPRYSLVAGEDSYPDLLVGRLSATTSYQLRTQVARIISYERYPAEGGDWYGRAMGVASANGPGDDGELDWEHIDVIRDRLLSDGYETVDRIYDPGATVTEVMAGFDEGRGLVNYCGDGSRTRWVTSEFSNTHVTALRNYERLPFVFMVSCVNGEFTGGTCLAEALLRATHSGLPTGAIGAYASASSQYWDPPMAAQDEFIDLLVRDERRTIGGLCFGGSCRMIDEYGTLGARMFQSWHLFGDPSVRIRTKAPARILVDHSDVLDRTATSMTVSVPDVRDALCGLSLAGRFLGSAVTNASGVAVVPIGSALEIGDTLALTVTGPDTKTYEGTITVVPHPGCDVEPSGFEISLGPEETADLDLVLANNGDDASVLEFAIDVNPPGLKSIAGSSIVADGASYRPGTTFDIRFAIMNGTPDSEWIKSAEIDFPLGVTVNSSTDFTVVGGTRKLLTNGAMGEGAEVIWNAPGMWGEIHGGEIAEAVVNVSVSVDFFDKMRVLWELKGDGWGAPPHVLYGEIVLSLSGPALLLHAPNGGEIVRSGEDYPVLWASSPGLAEVSIDLSVDGGMTWLPIAPKTENDGLYVWKVPAGASTSCLVRVSSPDGSVSDASDDFFRITEPITWLSVSPSSGSVAAGDAITVSVHVDASGLDPGDEEAILVITQNSGDPVSVPVFLHVTTVDIDPRRSRIEATNNVLLSPGGDADSTLRIVVTAIDPRGKPIPGIPAGEVAVHASGVSSIGQQIRFCETGLPHASFFSSAPTDSAGRAVLDIRRLGGCGTLTLHAAVEGIELVQSAVVNVRSPDLNGDGAVGFQDVFLYASFLNAGTGYCGNLNGDPNNLVNFADTAIFIVFYSRQSSCP